MIQKALLGILPSIFPPKYSNYSTTTYKALARVCHWYFIDDINKSFVVVHSAVARNDVEAAAAKECLTNSAETKRVS